MRMMAAVSSMLAGTTPRGNVYTVGTKKRAHGPAPTYAGGHRPSGPRISFTARSGRTIVRETVVGSDHERRLLRRKNARKIGA